MRINITRFSVGSSILALSLPVASAFAQPQGAAVSEPGADIVVTAQRRAQSLQDVPMAVDVVTGEQLQQLKLFDAKDVQQLAPGLQVTNNDGRSNVATLRGISFNPDSGTQPAVDLYINEVPVDAQTGFTAVYDIEQIEVLRGPQGIFRGRTSPAGSITISTRRPDLDKATGYVQATATNRHAYNVQGAASIPLVPGVLALRAAMLVDGNRSNQVRNVNLDRHSRADTQSGRLSLAFEPSPDFKSVLTYQYLHNDITPFIQVFGPGRQVSLLSPERSGPVASLRDRISVAEAVPRFQNRTHLITLASDYDFGAATLSFNGGFQRTVLEQFRDQDVANTVPGKTLNQSVRIPYRTWNADLRLASDDEGFFNWMVGATYSSTNSPTQVRQDNSQVFGLPFTPLPVNIVPAFPVDVSVFVPIKSRQYAAFGSVRLNLTDRLKLEAGARYTDYKVQRQSYLSVFLPSFGVYSPLNLPTISPANSTIGFKPLTGGASLSFEATRDLTLYTSYGRSFRPGVTAVGVTTTLDNDVLVTPKETSDSIEAGVKANLFDRRVSLNAAVYYQKFKNYISAEPCLVTNSTRAAGHVDATCAPLPTSGDAISKGAEIQLSFRPSRMIDFGLNASYADAHYDNAAVLCNDFNDDGQPDSTGTQAVQPGRQVSLCNRNDRIAEIPKFNLQATGEVRFDAGDLTPFLRGLVTFRPGYTSVATNYAYSDITTLNLFAGVRSSDGQWEVTGFVKNLFDQQRPTSVSQGLVTRATTGLTFPGFTPSGVAGAQFDSGYRTAVVTLPREFGLTLSFNW